MICDPSRPDLAPVQVALIRGGGASTHPIYSNSGPIARCYAEAAFASAKQMMRERQKRRAAQGLPLLIEKGHPDSYPTSPEACQNYASWHGGGTAESGRWYSPATDWNECLPNPSGYEGDYALSLRQFKADDEAERLGRPFTLLKSPDGISPFSPSRLAQVALEENFAALRSQEEETVRLLAQTLSPSQVAAISASQSTTDPIGRLLLGVLAQNAAHTAELGGPTPTSIPAMAMAPGQPNAVAMAGIVEDTGGGDPVLFWAIAIGGLLFSLMTGKKKVQVF